MERCAPDADAPQTQDALADMVHRLSAHASKALYRLRKQPVEPEFSIKRVTGWRQMSMLGLDKAPGEWSLATMA